MYHPSKMATNESKQQLGEGIDLYFDRILKTSRIQTRKNATREEYWFDFYKELCDGMISSELANIMRFRYGEMVFIDNKHEDVNKAKEMLFLNMKLIVEACDAKQMPNSAEIENGCVFSFAYGLSCIIKKREAL